jgi:hypothetical protein
MKERGSGLIRFGNERDAERAICKYISQHNVLKTFLSFGFENSVKIN